MTFVDFYPTPPALIERMLTGIDFTAVGSILEPSAGKGDIIDQLNRKLDTRWNRSAPKVDAIEVDPTLQHILRGKGYNLIHDDFLTFQGQKRYDLIIANPPFSTDAAHLQKAISLLDANGGSLVTLANAETIRNPYTQQRQAIVATLEQHGATIDYLTDEFVSAERKTRVEVALIRLHIARPERESVILDNLRRADPVQTTAHTSDQLVDADPVRALVARFDLECRAGIRLIDEYEALKPLVLKRLHKPGDDEQYNSPIMELKSDQSGHGGIHVNDYVRAVRRKYWEALIADDRFSRVYTSNVLKALTARLEDLAERDFTVFNIDQLQADLKHSLTSGVEDAIIAMFDEFSRKFAYSDEYGKNLHYYNGWKSNAAHKINRKIILPVNGFSSYSWGKTQLDTYYITEKIADLVKALNYLASELDSPIGIVAGAIGHANSRESFRNIGFHYFTATFFKKGTCHITFTDQRLLDKLNIYGSQRKGWLPPSYGRKRYREMTSEEQAVIDEFQGEEAYAAVLNEPGYYLSDPTPQLPATVSAA